VRIHHLKIENFRGIRHLDWKPEGSVICLIGPGDSTKTTVIEAIDLVLSPRWEIGFDDSDFYAGDTDSSIVITATVGELPDALLADNKFGLDIRGWSGTQGIHDEPEDEDDKVLTIELTVDSSLEPEWTVINDRNPDGRRISHRDRQLLGVLKLGQYVDRHFTWGSGTDLLRLTGEPADLRGLLAEAGRAARAAITPENVPLLEAGATKAERLAGDFGVVPKERYQPGLDIQRVNIGQGVIALHDGNVPLRRAGMGTKRLLALALQREAARDGGIVLVDEAENGLEPHRVRALVRKLRPEEGRGQVIMTSHSPVVIGELPASCLRIMRSNVGETTVSDVSASMQDIVRAASEALLGRKVIVCEGKTEVGFCRAFDRFWTNAGKEAFAYMGVVPVACEGSTASSRAVAIRKLGYSVCYLGDSDREITPTAETMRAAGIKVLVWADRLSIEGRVAVDLPWQELLEIVSLAFAEPGEESARASLAHQLGEHPDLAHSDFRSWHDSPELRNAIGRAAKEKGWFKRIGSGEKMGDIVCRCIQTIPATDLARNMEELRLWIDAND